VYLAVGKDNLNAVRKAIDASAAEPDKAVPPFEFVLSLGPFLEVFAAQTDDAEQRALAQSLAATIRNEAPGRDHIRVVGQLIPNGLRYRLEAEEGVLRAIGFAGRGAERFGRPAYEEHYRALVEKEVADFARDLESRTTNAQLQEYWKDFPIFQPPMTSLRTSCAIRPIGRTARVSAGSTRCQRKSREKMRAHSLGYIAPALFAPPEGNQPSVKAKLSTPRYRSNSSLSTTPSNTTAGEELHGFAYRATPSHLRGGDVRGPFEVLD
jgi:hypothetical protein